MTIIKLPYFFLKHQGNKYANQCPYCPEAFVFVFNYTIYCDLI